MGNPSSTYSHSHKQTYKNANTHTHTRMNELNGASRRAAIIEDLSNLGRSQRWIVADVLSLAGKCVREEP